MHEDEVTVTADDVRRLIAQQQPQWSALTITPVAESGTDHLLFRLGDRLVARMPTTHSTGPWSRGSTALPPLTRWSPALS